MVEDSRRAFFVSGGTLPPGSASYLERSADRVLLDALIAGEFCYVLNSRQLGKSSLSVHVIALLQERGVRTAFLDLTRIGGKNATPEQWYSGLALDIGRELDLRKEVLAYWQGNASVSPVQRLFDMLRDVVLARNEERLVICIDEIDTTRSLPFDADEFFAAIRESYNRRVSEPSFQRLTFCLLGVAVPSDLIRNPAVTPFNIGERILLEDFTLSELSAFASQLGPLGRQIVARVHYWTGGHPYLSQSLCRTIVAGGGLGDPSQVDDVVGRELFDQRARDANINLADVANIALHYSHRDLDEDRFRADVLSTYRRILAGRAVFDDESNDAVVVLKLSGLVRSDRRKLSVRNRIYQRVFDRQWIEERMPNQELRRQQQSYRRGVFRTALVSGSILAVVGAIAALAWVSRLEALDAKGKLAYELYVADMSGMSQNFENGDARRIEAVLDRHRNSPFRGFEWGFWLGRYHDSREEYTLDYSAPGKQMEGYLSTDGKEICLFDKLSLTAEVVDRASKKPLASLDIEPTSQILSLRSRWGKLMLESSSRYRVVDLMTGKPMCQIGEPNLATKWIEPLAHSDFIATGEGSFSADAPQKMNLWNVETGKEVFSIANPWKTGPSKPWKVNLFAFSPDGRYVLYSRGPFGPVPGDADRAFAGEAVVLDRGMGTVVDRFPIDNYTELGANGIQGDRIFLLDRSKGFVRDIRRRRSVPWVPDAPGDWSIVNGALSGHTLAVLLNGGRCAVRDLDGVGSTVVRGNVFALAPGAEPGQYLASSSTVRLYDDKSPSDTQPVADGSRITRFSKGVLNIFGAPGAGVLRVDEADLRKMGTIPNLSQSSYTYSGRWFVTNGNVLNDAIGKIPSAPLPVSPTIWSGGQDPNSIALWRVDAKAVTAYSFLQRRVRWVRTGIDGVDALWVSPDGSRAFFTTGGHAVTVLDMANGRTLGVLDSHNVGRLFLTFSADGNRTFTCAEDGRAIMWDTHNLRKLVEFRGNDQVGMRSADISPDGSRVVTTNTSGAWQLWDAANGVLLTNVHASTAALKSAVFCSDGRRIVTAGEDGKVRIWRTIESDPTTFLPIDRKRLKNLHL